ncbi:MAG: hypothetical protein KJ042_17415, partial [Deltaproteobacteria bacterium]|nr:hypothetical protein [Deltaproteobacteria bacterium]
MSDEHEHHDNPVLPPDAVAAPAPAPPPSGRRKALFIIAALVVAMIVVSLVAETGLRFSRMRARQQTAQLAIPDPCKSLIFLTMGDSMTWGLGADHAT